MDETRRNEIGATVFAILLGLSALFFTAWLFTGGGCSDQHQIIAAVSDQPVKAVVDKSDDTANLKADLEAAQLEIKAEAARRAELATDKLNLEAKLNAMAGNDLKAEIGKLRLELNALKGAQGKLDGAMKANNGLELKLADLTAKFGAATKSEGDLKLKLSDLTGKFDASAKSADALKVQLTAATKKASAADMANAEAGKLRLRITDLEKKLNDAGKQKLAMTAGAGAAVAVQAELAALKKKAAADAKTAADKLAAAQKKLADSSKAMAANAGDAAKKLQAELAALKKKAAADGTAWGAAKTKLTASNAGLQKQIDALKKQLAAKAAMPAPAPAPAALAPAAAGLPILDLPLLVNDPAKLNPSFKSLFANLRGIDDSPAAREKAYTKITSGGKQQPVLRVPFASSSDYISGDYSRKIAALAKEAGAGAKFLAVGYASSEGSNETNYRLSSQRASNVGKKLADALGSEDNVQAVYFGQTKRFSSKRGPNRIVEIWRVK